MNPPERTEAIVAAERAGIDLSLVDANLRLSVLERWQQHDAALELFFKLQLAGEDLLTAKELRAIAEKRK